MRIFILLLLLFSCTYMHVDNWLDFEIPIELNNKSIDDISKWVNDNIEYKVDLTAFRQIPSEILKSKVGCCQDMAWLKSALFYKICNKKSTLLKIQDSEYINNHMVLYMDNKIIDSVYDYKYNTLDEFNKFFHKNFYIIETISFNNIQKDVDKNRYKPLTN